jgi:hypothetical protein
MRDDAEGLRDLEGKRSQHRRTMLLRMHISISSRRAFRTRSSSFPLSLYHFRSHSPFLALRGFACSV